MDHHSESHADGHHASTEDMPFTEQEVQMLHRQDMTAATYVVGLMLVIFGVGILIYTIVAISAAP